jgi:hypothetical protein
LAERHNAEFARSYDRWFRAVYRGKYDYLGEFDLVRLAFQLDLGMYYLGVASQPFKHGRTALAQPVFTQIPSVPVYHLMKLYNSRLASIARSRRGRNTLGRRNEGRRTMVPGFTLDPSSCFPVVSALAGWLRLEVVEGWRSWWPRHEETLRGDEILHPSGEGVP